MARIWATRLGFGSHDWDLGLEQTDGQTDGRTEKEKIPYMCESIGYPLLGHCPASQSTSNTTFLSEAWVPLTI